MSRMRLSVAALVVLALAGLTAGLLTARGSGAERLRPGVLASGRFETKSVSTTGRAMIVRRADGSVKLRILDLSTRVAPELVVELAAPGSDDWHYLDDLHSAGGDQQYSLPADVAKNLPQTVRIFCAKCGKTWGSALLRVTNT